MSEVDVTKTHKPHNDGHCNTYITVQTPLEKFTHFLGKLEIKREIIAKFSDIIQCEKNSRIQTLFPEKSGQPS